MEPIAWTGTPRRRATKRPGASGTLSRDDDNRNRRITCKVARRHGSAPVHRSHPAYRCMSELVSYAG